MPIIVHYGNPRQGKSYAAIADHIVPALGAGRRVVTNIEGMGDPDRVAKMQALVEKRHKRSDPIDFQFVPHSQLERATIFPVDTHQEDQDGTRVFDDSSSVVKFGTLIVWDEARQFSSDKLPKVWHEALTYHGHWARDGSTVDIVLIHQSWKTLAPLVRATSELVYEFVKKTSGKGYTRFTYASPGDRELYRKAAGTLSESFTYDAEIFALYKTNASDGATNDNVAVPFWKTTYFRSKLKLIVILLVVGCAWLAWSLWKFVGGLPGGKPQAAASVAGAPIATVPGMEPSTAGLPAIVGRLPVAGGYAVIVRDGEAYNTVTPRNGVVTYRGRVLEWPSDF